MVIKKFVKQLFGIVLDLICPAGKHEIDKQNPCKKLNHFHCCFAKSLFCIQFNGCRETKSAVKRCVWVPGVFEEVNWFLRLLIFTLPLVMVKIQTNTMALPLVKNDFSYKKPVNQKAKVAKE